MKAEAFKEICRRVERSFYLSLPSAIGLNASIGRPPDELPHLSGARSAQTATLECVASSIIVNASVSTALQSVRQMRLHQRTYLWAGAARHYSVESVWTVQYLTDVRTHDAKGATAFTIPRANLPSKLPHVAYQVRCGIRRRVATVLCLLYRVAFNREGRRTPPPQSASGRDSCQMIQI